jgi:hypothetical protein
MRPAYARGSRGAAAANGVSGAWPSPGTAVAKRGVANVPDSHPERPGRASGPAASRGASGLSAALCERLRQVATAAAAPEDALEPALLAILEATGAAAGAICLYDQRRELLRLAAESGISDEGCRRLRSVRRGDAAGWDMPLHGMLNRRAYLIDSASTNRFVPPLVDGPARVRTVACLPLYAGQSALGSLILVTLAPRAFGEREIRGVEQPLRELATIIEALRRRAPVDLPTEPPPAGPPRPAAAPPPRVSQGAPPPEVERLTAALAAAERERERLAAALEAASAAGAAGTALQAALDEARGAQQAARAEIEELRARLTESESAAAARCETIERAAEERVRRLEEALAAERERAAQWERRHAELSEELRAARTRAERAEAELEAGPVRDTVEGLGDLQQALVVAQAAEAERAEARQEAAAARTALADAEARAQAADVERRRLEREVAVLRARLAEEGAAEEDDDEESLRVESIEAPELEAETEPSAPARPAPAPPADRIGAGIALVVLDVGGVWAEAAPSGLRTAVVPPGNDIATRLDADAAGCVLANLAAPGALAALGALRAAGARARFEGCLVEPGGARALRLGTIEPATRPLDADALVAALAGSASRGTRVVTVGSDVDALMSLRQAMARQGMSVSMAWDAKQAADLLAMVRPEIVVVDLDAACDAYALAASVGAGASPPGLVLVPGSSDAAVGFAAALAERAVLERARPLDALLADVLRGRARPPDGPG